MESRRTKITKMLFHDALIELMQEKPFYKITIKEICEQADLNRATFYLHYNTQQEVLQEILDEVKDKTEKYIKGHAKDPNEVELLEIYFEYIKNNSVIFRTLFSGETGFEARCELNQQIFDDLGKEWPVFGSPSQNHYVYTFIIQGSSHVIQQWIENGFDLSAKELAKLIYKLSTFSGDQL